MQHKASQVVNKTDISLIASYEIFFPWPLSQPRLLFTTIYPHGFLHFRSEWKNWGCASESYAADLAKTVSVYPPKASDGISAAFSLKSDMSPAISQTDQVPLFGQFVTEVEDASLNRRVLSLFHDAKL